METWGLIWEHFRWGLFSSVIAGLVCPLIGSFLLVRRTGFYGVTLPQFAAAGMALGFAVLPWWIANIGLGEHDVDSALESPHAIVNYLLAWATTVTFAGLAILTAFSRNRATETGRVAVGFALANALTTLLAMVSPVGGEITESLLHGQILTVGLHEFEFLAASSGLVLLLFLWFQRDLLLVSFDRDTAIVLGKSVRRFELLLMLLVGLTVSVGVIVVGPMVLFGLLAIPPMAARAVARSMNAMFALSGLFGVCAALIGTDLAWRLDWALGPSVVLAAGAVHLVAWTAGKLRARR